VDRSAVAEAGNDDAFQSMLDEVCDRAYDVRTSSQLGSRGDRTFMTTYVTGRAQGVPQRLSDDMPVDTTDMQREPAAAKVTDDDIPF
jgi:hypothetical protein